MTKFNRRPLIVLYFSSRQFQSTACFLDHPRVSRAGSHREKTEIYRRKESRLADKGIIRLKIRTQNKEEIRKDRFILVKYNDMTKRRKQHKVREHKQFTILKNFQTSTRINMSNYKTTCNNRMDDLNK